MGLAREVFERMVGDEAAADGALPPAQRQAAARNFMAFVGSHVLTKLGDALTSPKTTLTWLAAALGVPGGMAGLLVPLRESGSMVVQIGLATVVQRFRRRKWVWSLGAALQGLAMLAVALASLRWRGVAAGVAMLAGVTVFALARSLSSIASKDVLGRTQAPGRRGQATGWATGAAGALTLGLGAAAALLAPSRLPVSAYALLLALAASLWWIAAMWFVAVREPPARRGGADGGARLRLLWSDPRLRRFVLVRALFLCTALSAPFYVLLAQRALGDGPRQLAAFVLAEGVAGMLGGPVWGRLADRSSRRVMMAGAGAGALLGVALAAVAAWRPQWLLPVVVMPLAYLGLSLAHQGVRIGRKTWVVDAADDALRSDYVATSNAAIGLLLLPVGGAAAALASWWLPAALWGLAGLALLGLALARRLPEAHA